MAFFKLSLLARLQDSGASETYWLDATDRDAAIEIADEMLGMRRAFISSLSKMQGFRLTPLSIAGIPSGKQRSYDRRKAGLVGVPLMKKDEDDTSLELFCEDASGDFTKRGWLRFPPDEWVLYDDNGDWAPPQLAQDAWKPFLDNLKSGVFHIRRWNDNLNSNPNSAIVSKVNIDSDGLLSVTLNDPIDNLQPGFKAKLKGYAGALGKSLNGVYRVLGITNLEVFLDAIVCQHKGTSTPGSGASLFQEQYIFEVITKADILSSTSHDTGRSFFLRRGRRSKRPKCLLTRVGA